MARNAPPAAQRRPDESASGQLPASRGAADDFVRDLARTRSATFGLYRFSLTQLAARFAAPFLARERLAPTTGLGVQAVAARAFATSVDWRTTFLVPVPPMATRFRQTLVGANRGIVIEGPLFDPETKVETGNWNLLLWSQGGRVYGIRSTMRWSRVT